MTANRNAQKGLLPPTGMRPIHAIIILTLIGIAAASYGLYLHYAPLGTGICNVNQTFNCDTVNKSQWSELFGIPVALLGLLAYAALLLGILTRRRIARTLEFTQRDVWAYLLAFTSVMLLFQLYLTSLELFIIHAYCIICLVSQATIIAIEILVAYEYVKARA